MSKIMFILFIGCFVCLAQIKAQTDNSAPTKEDAVNFIRKVYNEFNHVIPSSQQDNPITKSNFEVKFDSCILAFQFYSDSHDGNTYYRDTSAVIINLSQIKFEYDIKDISNIIGLEPDAIIVEQYSYTKEGTKHNWKRERRLDDFYSVKDFNFQFPTYVDNDNERQHFRIRYDFDYKNPEYLEKRYSQRLRKAIQFLIKACGGGRVKADSNDKF